ncbi:MAG: hypothetical protein Q4G39_00505 [Brachymonas sp.]|nr:hypothetical protein [Brachymonas sp.]
MRLFEKIIVFCFLVAGAAMLAIGIQPAYSQAAKHRAVVYSGVQRPSALGNTCRPVADGCCQTSSSSSIHTPQVHSC